MVYTVHAFAVLRIRIRNIFLGSGSEIFSSDPDPKYFPRFRIRSIFHGSGIFSTDLDLSVDHFHHPNPSSSILPHPLSFIPLPSYLLPHPSSLVPPPAHLISPPSSLLPHPSSSRTPHPLSLIPHPDPPHWAFALFDNTVGTCIGFILIHDLTQYEVYYPV